MKPNRSVPLLVSTVLTLFVIPAIYSYLSSKTANKQIIDMDKIEEEIEKSELEV